MKAAYLEPSAINWYLDAAIAGRALQAAARQGGFRPVVGLHTIYELARTFLREEGRKRGKELFTFLAELDPSLTPGPSALMVAEIDRLRTGTAVWPFLGHLDQAATRLEIGRLSEGVFDDRARAFIERREQEIAGHRSTAMA